VPESDATQADGGGARPVVVDTADLRQRMMLAFSAQELAELAATRGVAEGAGRADANARGLIRSYERDGDLGGLLARLREARPLFEWPDASVPEAAPAAVDEAAAPGADAEPAAPAPPDADAAPPTTPAGTAPAPLPDAAPVAWPGVQPEAVEKPRDRGLDPRLLVLVSGLTLVAALVAFAAGRVSSAPRPGDDAKSAAAANTRRAPGLATHAADALARHLAGVAAACEVPATDDATVMQRAAEHCGPPPPPRPRPALPPTEPAPSAAPEPSDEPAAGRYGIPAPTPPTRAPGEGPCIKGCEATHSACLGRCGTEPTQGSQYADYQQCLAKCLSATSKCRLACQ
jgi:hypothetical protein